MADLDLQNISKRFGSVDAVRELNLRVSDGELVSLVGPSGCGKTTTLRMIAGLETPSHGCVYFDQQLMDRVPPRQRNVAMVFQDDTLQPHLTIGRNLAFGLRMRRFSASEINQRVSAVAEQFGLTPWLQRKPHELSGGQRQRVALARSLIRAPAVLLFDEPLSNLDAPTRVELRNELARRRGEFPCATVYVTHDQAEALSLGDRVAVMNEGRIEQLGTPREVYETPATRFVAEFIGNPAMNIMSAFVREQEGQRFLSFADVALPIDKELRQLGAGAELLVGIRPEHWRISSGESATSIRAQVSVVQYLGAELVAECQTGSETFVLRIPTTSNIQPGQKLLLDVPLADCHLFDKSNGRRLA